MPPAPKRRCTYPGCNALSTTGRCERHPIKAWSQKRETPVKRVTGRRLQEMRHQLFTRNPLCAECERQGRVTLATQRDHIVPLCEGGSDEPENIQGLCAPCHGEKTLAEALRARTRPVP
ncbi:HNH endonuclease [Aquabacterium sp. A7-Y]|uniref:HNH endonuclease n=1 Tax=Aquabacterium sp. A7-Y TaxID=1349605 RepID=UPI00223CC8A7|nr:HNH endonuclease signature motif containing protein [Aquabacterium sp. A7-Y]MCW7542003.1 HNH endonuclease [Aquabacterium sp. A7-Y]